MNILLEIITESWHLLQGASIYVLFGIFMAGLMRVFLDPNSIARHLGGGRFSSIIKAGLLGVPIPLCSCGVLPAATSLKKQGANTGAVTAFLISTPESGVDSIALTYALLDPVMTIARPTAAFATAAVAGIAENSLNFRDKEERQNPDLSCPIDQCCDGTDCPPDLHRHHHPFKEKIKVGLQYAVNDLWDDIAGWFLFGILLAGLITVLIPSELISQHLGGGISSMLFMLVVGIPTYICATASTPIAAALILKGVSPGAALVFLLAGPATNITSLTVLFGVLGKRGTMIYLAAISVMAVVSGLILDQIYALSGISAQAVVGQAVEVIPSWVQLMGAFALIGLSVKPISHTVKGRFGKRTEVGSEVDCGCATGLCRNPTGVTTVEPVIHNHP